MSASGSKYLDSFKKRVVEYALKKEPIDYDKLEKKFNVPRKTVYNWVYDERQRKRKANKNLDELFGDNEVGEVEQNGSEPITADMLNQVKPEEDRVTWIVPGGIVVDYLARIATALERLAELWEK